jgi:RHS repeat-associated protein
MTSYNSRQSGILRRCTIAPEQSKKHLNQHSDRDQTMMNRLQRALLGVACFGVGLSFSATASATVAAASKGDFGVSAMGAATYHMPLSLPPGVAGLQPHLSLDYGSTSGDLFMGRGWSIGGLSVISRCPATKAVDNYTQGILWNATDRLCLDGQQLVPIVAGTYFQAGAEYRTRIESFRRIVPTGGNAVFPDYFTVKTKSGLTMTYGQTATGQVDRITHHHDGVTVYEWLLDSVTDSAGNTITYTYSYEGNNGDYYPDTITYGGNSKLQTGPTVTIKFEWQNRPSTSPNGYVDGIYLNYFQFLSRIDASVNGVQVRHWKLGYQDGVVLSSVTECAGGDENNCAKPTQFAWNPQSSGAATVQNIGNFANPFTGMIPGFYGTGPFVGDFNGDGKADVLTITGGFNPVSGAYVPNFSVQIAWSGGTAGYSNPQPLAGTYPNSIPYINGCCWDFATGDFNMDGKTDLLIAGWAPGDTSTTVQLFLSNGDGSFNLGPKLSYPALTGYQGTHPVVADFNGDGIPDILLATGIPGDSHEYLDFLISNGPDSYTAATYTLNGGGAGMSAYAADLNGDGLADVVLVYNPLGAYQNIYAYTFLNQGGHSAPLLFGDTPSYTTSITPSLPPYPYLWGLTAGISFADVNGDGNADMIYTTEEQTSNGATLCTGVLLSQADGTLTAPVESTADAPGFPYIWQIGNFGGDGKASVAWTPEYAGSTNIIYQLSRGDGTYSAATFPSSGAPFTPALGFAMAGDFLGLGQDEVFNYSGTASTSAQVVQLPLPADRRITNITDGFGQTTSINYASIAASTGVYSETGEGVAYPNDQPVSYPNMALRSGYVVVSKTSILNPVNSSKDTTYTYHNARFNWQGLGFLGFWDVCANDVSGGTARILKCTRYRQDFPYIGRVSSVGMADQRTGKNIYSLGNTWAYKADGLSYFVYLASSNSVDQDPQTGVTYRSHAYSVGSYDDYGCPLSTTDTVYSGDIGATPSYTTSTTYTPQNDTTDWYLCRNSDVVVTRSETGHPDIAREVSYRYDMLGDAVNNTGLLLEKTVEPTDTGALYLDTLYGRDSFGNIHTAKTSGYNTTYLTPRTLTYNYTTDGRFLTSVCNDIQPCTGFTFYADTGNLHTTTDPNGLLTTYAQDSFGRQSGSSINQTDLNVSSSATWYWCTDASISALCADGQAAVFGKKVVASDGRSSVVIYDQAQRPVVQAQLNGDGKWIETLTQYDIEGRPLNVSASKYQGSNTTFWTSTGWDDLNRPLQTTAPQDQNHPTANTTIYTYNGLATTVEDGNQHHKTTTLTALGQPAEVVDDSNAALVYDYNAFGDLLQTQDPSGNTVVMTYDTLGRKLTMTDPDMGAWSYTYDSLGEVLTQKNAKLIGGKTTYAYDVLGRMISRSTSDNDYTWTWDNPNGVASKWIGALSEATMYPHGSTTVSYDRSYLYTDFGSIKADTQTIDGTPHTTNYGFDTLGRVNLLTYPSTFAVSIGYNSYGAETSITDAATNGIALWTANAWDNWGHIDQETLGPSAVVNGVYLDLAVGSTSSIVAGPNGGASVANLSYTWDPIGNVTQGDAANQTYSYDDLNRLHTDAPTSFTIDYDPLGNIKDKTDIGAYTYDPSLPHAVASAGGMTYSYDANGNTTKIRGSDYRNYTWTADNALSNVKDVTSRNQVAFEYGADGELVSQTASWGAFYNQSQTTIYLGDGLEEAGSGNLGTTTNDYILAPTGPVAMVVHSPSQADAVQYLAKDNLGSVVAVTDDKGSVIQSYAYDVVGKRTVTSTASNYSGILTDLGYTGHIQIDSINLIHMGGRVYDAAIARFLSPDPYIPDPLDLQSYNRYSYVSNNPLTRVDPSGFTDVPIPTKVQMALQASPMSYTISFSSPGGGATSSASGGSPGAVGGGSSAAVPGGSSTSQPAGPSGAAGGGSSSSGGGGGGQIAGSDSGPVPTVYVVAHSSAFGSDEMDGDGRSAGPAISSGVGAAVGVPGNSIGSSTSPQTGVVSGTGADANGESTDQSGIETVTVTAKHIAQEVFGPLDDPILTPDGMTPLEELPPGEAGGPNAEKNFPKNLGKPGADEEMPDCTYCGGKTTREPGPRQLNRDHIIPKSRGGTNSPENQAPSCRGCNLQKGGRTPREWYQWINGRLYTWLDYDERDLYKNPVCARLG